jgi:hypothetical protein
MPGLEAAAEKPQPVDDLFRILASTWLEAGPRTWRRIARGWRCFHELLLAGRNARLDASDRISDR